MQELKYCEICGVLISDIKVDNPHRHIKVKYCDECREYAKLQKAKIRSRANREKNKNLNIIRKKEIIIFDSLMRIKLECKESEDCDQCLLYVDGLCILKSRPDSWPDYCDLIGRSYNAGKEILPEVLQDDI